MRNLKSLLILLNLIALVAAIIWVYQSKFDYEPVIAVLGLTATLFGLFFNKISLQKKNKSLIKGNDNKVTQKGLTKNKDSSNESNIDGDGNFVKQNN